MTRPVLVAGGAGLVGSRRPETLDAPVTHG